MEFVADFHIHSKYSRATSRSMDIPNLAKWAKLKGVDLLGTGYYDTPDSRMHLLFLEYLGSQTQIIESSVGTAADDYLVDFNIADFTDRLGIRR